MLNRKVQCWIFSRSLDRATDSELCLLLKTNRARGGFWQPVTGTVEAEEGYFEAACRETAEETGFTFTSTPLDSGFEFDYTSRFGPAREHIFALTVDAAADAPPTPRLDPKEHDDFLWTQPRDAISLLRFQSNVDGLKRTFKLVFGKALLALALAAALPSSHALAAQDAIVTVEQAAVREVPSIDAKILESKPVGSKIHVSSYSKDGWYKVRAVTGQYGWIWQGDLTLTSYQDDVKAASLDLPEREHDRRDPKHIPWFFLRGGGGVMPGLSQLADNTPTLNAEISGFAQAGIRILSDLRGVARLMSYASVFTVADFGNPTDLSVSGTAAMIGLEQDFGGSDTTRWWLGFYGGIDLASSVSGNTGITNPASATATGQSVSLSGNNTQMTISATGYPFMFTIGYSHQLTTWVSLLGEAGLFYNYIPQLPIPNFGSSHISEYGPIFNFGVQLSI